MIAAISIQVVFSAVWRYQSKFITRVLILGSADIAALIEHALADRGGDWKVSILGSQASDRWEMRILGPNEFERTYMLEGIVGECEPQAIGRIVRKMVPKSQNR
jgi:hypothetical protein